MKEIIDMITSNGMSVVIIGYFIFKDWKINSEMLSILTELKGILSKYKALDDK